MALIVQTAEGLAEANAYDDEAAFASFLTSRGKPAFAALDAGDQEAVALEAMEAAEDEVEARVDGEPLLEEQATLFPRRGARDRRDRLIDGLPPTRYRRSIMLLAGEMAAVWPKALDLNPRPAGHVKSEGARGWTKTYRDEDITLADRYPSIWRGLASAFPRGLRQRRA